MENKTHICTEHDQVTLILKVVDYCNFTCDFCRYPNNPHKSVMPFSTFQTIIEKACAYNISKGSSHLTIIFHGGEPLLWGYDNFVSAMRLEKELSQQYPKFNFKNNIQTNGSLLNDQWIDFLVENNFDIGISIDGPEEINFHKGYGSNIIVLKNIHKLVEKKCHFGILSVITNDHSGCADKYYDFLVEHNIHSVGFCYCIYDFDKHITVNNDILTDFLKHFFDRYFAGEYQLNVREFENVIKKCLNVPTHACTFANRQGCGNYFSIRPNGDVIFCDPYVLDIPPIGNIINETFFDIKSKPELRKIIISARESSQKECKKCEIFRICGGGCYRNTLSDGKSIFCETYKSLYPYIQTIVNSSNQGTAIVAKG